MTSSNHNHDTATEALIDRYLLGQLPAEDLAAFELRMLEDPAFFETVEQAELLRQAFRYHGNSSGIIDDSAYAGDTEDRKDREEAGSEENKVYRLSFPQWIRQPLSMAASILLVITVGFSRFEVMQSPGTDSAPASQSVSDGYAINSVVTIARTRSTDQDIELPSGVHLLQLDVGISMNEPVYAVTMTRVESDEQYRFTLTPDGNGMLRLLTSDTWQGEYILEVIHGAGNTDNEADAMVYALRFVEEDRS